jgi:hypothetical protein
MTKHVCKIAAPVSGIGLRRTFRGTCSCGWRTQGATWAKTADLLIAHREEQEEDARR